MRLARRRRGARRRPRRRPCAPRPPAGPRCPMPRRCTRRTLRRDRPSRGAIRRRSSPPGRPRDGRLPWPPPPNRRRSARRSGACRGRSDYPRCPAHAPRKTGTRAWKPGGRHRCTPGCAPDPRCRHLPARAPEYRNRRRRTASGPAARSTPSATDAAGDSRRGQNPASADPRPPWVGSQAQASPARGKGPGDRTEDSIPAPSPTTRPVSRFRSARPEPSNVDRGRGDRLLSSRESKVWSLAAAGPSSASPSTPRLSTGTETRITSRV